MNRVELVEHMQSGGALEGIVPAEAYVALSEALLGEGVGNVGFDGSDAWRDALRKAFVGSS